MVNVSNVNMKPNTTMGVTKKGNSYVKCESGAKKGAAIAAGLNIGIGAVDLIKNKKENKDLLNFFGEQVKDCISSFYKEEVEFVKMLDGLEMNDMPVKLLKKMVSSTEKISDKKIKIFIGGLFALATLISIGLYAGIGAGIGKIAESCVNKFRANKADKAAELNQQA